MRMTTRSHENHSRSVYTNSITNVEIAGAERGQFLMARGVRQSCPANGFLFAMAFDPVFQWLQEAIIPRNPDNLDFFQPAQCVYADDLAVASSSIRELMHALAPAFRSVAGLCANYRKCCWGQYGNEEHDSLWTWIWRIVKNSMTCRLFDTPNMLEQ